MYPSSTVWFTLEKCCPGGKTRNILTLESPWAWKEIALTLQRNSWAHDNFFASRQFSRAFCTLPRHVITVKWPYDNIALWECREKHHIWWVEVGQNGPFSLLHPSTFVVKNDRRGKIDITEFTPPPLQLTISSLRGSWPISRQIFNEWLRVRMSSPYADLLTSKPWTPNPHP